MISSAAPTTVRWYRRHPEHVEAVQWNGINLDAVREMIPDARVHSRAHLPGGVLSLLGVEGGKGRVAQVGDFLVRRSDGALDVYSPGMFHSLFRAEDL